MSNINDFVIENGVLTKYNGVGGNVVIPDGVTSIGQDAFYNCRSLTSVTIPEGVTSIGDSAFRKCSGLTSVTIPESVTSIGQYTFSLCSSLESVTIPNSVTNIGSSAFSNCSSLESVTIPESVTRIGDFAFSGCNSLTSVTIPESVTRIGDYIFQLCSSLESVTIQEGVPYISALMFYNCSGLTSVTIPSSVTFIGTRAFSGCSSLTSVTILGGVTSIGAGAFQNCSGLTSVTIPSSVTSIGDKAFGYKAFSGCSGLTDIYIKQYKKSSYLSGTEPWGAESNVKVHWLGDYMCTVIFVDYDDTILKTESILQGEAATPPEAPSHNDMVFQGWDAPYDNIQSDITIRAVYIILQQFTVTFLDYDDTLLKTERVIQGESATPPEIPEHSDMVFQGWSGPYDNIQSDTTIRAVYYYAKKYTVTFLNWDNTVLKTEQVAQGGSATPPKDPVREGYSFVGWDGVYTNVQSDAVVSAAYMRGGTNKQSLGLLFDTQNAPLPIRMILGTRSGRIIREMPINHIKFTDDLGSGSEVAFCVYKERCVNLDGEIDTAFWEKIDSMRLAYCPEFDQWYEMKVEFTDSSEVVKSVVAASLGESELSQIRAYGMEINTEADIARDDYRPTVLYSADKSVSLLDRLLYKAPHYRIAHVDESIRALQRTYQFNDKSIYDCFQEIAKEIGCLFRVHCGRTDERNIERTISVYDLWNRCEDCGTRGEFAERCDKCGSEHISFGYGKNTGVYVDKDNLADEVTFMTDIGSIKNCFRLTAGDDLMTAAVVSCNPNGSQYMWYIPEYMQEDMSEELKDRINEYNRLYDYYEKEHVFSAALMIADE